MRAQDALANPAIDAEGCAQAVHQALDRRAARRISEDEFIRMSRLPGTVILDTRSREKFDALHVRGALNLSFPDLAADALARLLPDRAPLILIYCNNNFTSEPDAFPAKLPPAALNLATYAALHTYGYRNVYELGPPLFRSVRLGTSGQAAEPRRWRGWFRLPAGLATLRSRQLD